jgi:RecA-family ATPase
MERIAAALAGLAVVAFVDWPDAPPKGDAADYVVGRTAGDVRALLSAAIPVLPPPSPIVGIEAYRAAVPATVPWVVEPLAYAGGVTLIAGPPKAGKSTLAAQLERCRETGLPLFGRWPVTIGPTLLVTEEGGVAVVRKTDGLRDLDVLDRRAAGERSWEDVLGLIREWCEAHPAALVVIDTLAVWAGITDENDAAQVTAAIAPIMLLAQETNASIVLVHHTRKGGGDNGEAIRGSSAILATVDVAAELSRDSPESDDRWLDVQGRVLLPDRHRLAFDRDSGTYSLVDRTRLVAPRRSPGSKASRPRATG